jgi:hypothetical protein
MSGHTGKLTREALRQRGPRMVAVRIRGDREGEGTLGIVIMREGASCFQVTNTDAASNFTYKVSEDRYFFTSILAKSFTLGYLMKLARTALKIGE